MADEKTPETSDQIKEIEEKIVKAKQAYLVAAKDLKPIYLEELRVLNDSLRIEQARLDLAKETRQLKEKQLKDIEKELGILGEILKAETDSERVKKAQYEYTLLDYKYLNLKKELGQQLSEDEEKRLKDADELIKRYRVQTAELERPQEAQQKIKQTWDTIENALSAISGGYTKQITQMRSMQGIAAGIGSLVKEMVETNESLAKATGKVGLINKESFSGVEKYAIGYREMGKATAALFENMSRFSALSAPAQKDLAQHAAKMENLGVSAEMTGKLFNDLSRSLGMNDKQLKELSDRITTVAIGLGISASKAFKDFSATLPALASHGMKSKEVFFDLQKQSKALGIEMTTLLGIIGEGFDTFEGAADKAGKLNAILGGTYLNSVEMLNATESERVDLLKQAFEASGKNWDSLDRFEKKAIAASLGIKDVNEASKLFKELSIEDQKAMEAQAATQKELEDAQMKVASTTRQLELAFSKLAIAAEPLAKAIKWIAELLSESPGWTTAIAVVIAIAFSFAKFTQFLATTRLALMLLSRTAITSSVELAAEAPVVSAAITEIGGAATLSAGGLMALGFVFLSIGGAIALAGWGIAQIVLAFAGLKENGWAAATAVIAFSAAFAIATYVIVSAAVPLAAAILIIGKAGTFGAIGLGLIAAVILSIGYSIKMATEGVAKMITAVTELTTRAINLENLKSIKTAVGEIVDAIKLIPEDASFNARVNTLKSISEINKTQTVNELIKTGSTVNEQSLKPAKEFVVAAEKYYIAQASAKSVDQDALVQAINSLRSDKNKATGEKSKEQPVILRIENGPDLRAYVLGGKFVNNP